MIFWRAKMTKHTNTRKKYSKTFRARAVKLASLPGAIVSEVARQLGVPDKTLYGWISAEREKTEVESDINNESMKMGNKNLQERIKRLEVENEILKKAAIYFAGTHS
jgi:transposase